jgi:probable addiction module antidote protein
MSNDKAIHHRPFDPAEFLSDAESQAEALNEALASGNKDVILAIVNAIARARGMSELARETGIKRETLYAALRDGANPTMETFLAVINALGIALRAETRTEPERERELADA